MKVKNIVGLLFGLSLSCAAFAAEQVAKEETTPPAAEGVPAANQIPPINSAAKLNTPTPQNAPTPSKPVTSAAAETQQQKNYAPDPA